MKVDGQLRVEGVPGVFAFGDCAWCPQPDGKSVPPRAQSAHQQADYLYALLQRRPAPTSGRARRTCSTTTARSCRSAPARPSAA